MNFEQFRINNQDKSQVKIVPDTSRDILFNDDFILGIINNSGYLINENKNEDIKKSLNNNENKENNNEDNLPYIIFLSFIYKSNFIRKIEK